MMLPLGKIYEYQHFGFLSVNYIELIVVSEAELSNIFL